MPKLDVLISTCNARIEQLPALLPKPIPDIGYIVVHQIFAEQGCANSITALETRQDVTYIASDTRGLSRSRNIALAASTAELVLFSDDDVTYLPEALPALIQAFESTPQADLLTFRFCTPDGKLKKKYPEALCQRHRFSIFRISSVEVAARRAQLQNHAIQFDERFGLGADYAVSEENIFLSDCLKAKLTIFTYPLTILCHPEETSGGTWDLKTSQARGAMFKRVFGWAGAPVMLLFMCKHFKKFGTLRYFFKNLMSAMQQFMRLSTR